MTTQTTSSRVKSGNYQDETGSPLANDEAPDGQPVVQEPVRTKRGICQNRTVHYTDFSLTTNTLYANFLI